MNPNLAPMQDPVKHSDPDLELDLDRVVWDPLYRRNLIARLACETCERRDRGRACDKCPYGKE